MGPSPSVGSLSDVTDVPSCGPGCTGPGSVVRCARPRCPGRCATGSSRDPHPRVLTAPARATRRRAARPHRRHPRSTTGSCAVPGAECRRSRTRPILRMRRFPRRRRRPGRLRDLDDGRCPIQPVNSEDYGADDSNHVRGRGDHDRRLPAADASRPAASRVGTAGELAVVCDGRVLVRGGPEILDGHRISLPPSSAPSILGRPCALGPHRPPSLVT